MHVGKVLRKLRRAQGKTQEDIARVAGLHSVTLSRIERRKHQPDLATLEALAKALDTTAAAVLAAAAAEPNGDAEPDPNGEPQPASKARAS